MVDVQSIGTGVSAVKEDPSTEHLPYELISKLQEKFSSAIQYIKGEQVVGVVAKGLTISRFGKLSWLQISTKRMLFLFDILSISAEGFKNGLKSVLQDETILKVVHDCRLLSDCTYHQFGVYLSNVFDTQVADAIVTKESSGGKWPCKVKTLRECLYNYLPWVTLPPAQQASEAAWMTRPCPNRLLNAATAEAWHLLSLREALLERMMAPFTSCVDFYLGYYRNAPDDKHRNFPSESMDLLSELPSVYEAEAASPRLSENAQRSGSRRQDLSE
uniref:3'-5' exonuclease domain-containing protein n=1 Tax=Eptatretus burgeri TaxID=7764 RepID=A0A8C4Q1L5_EPTBU